MSLHPLDPEIVRETDRWFYTSHPRGRELDGAPLDPTAAEDAEGRRAWVAEYRRRLAEKQARNSAPPPAADKPVCASDPLAPSLGCCPTDFMVLPESTTLEAGETAELIATDSPVWGGFGQGTYTWTSASQKLMIQGRRTGTAITVAAGPVPNVPPQLGELVEVTRTQPGCAPITRPVRVFIQKCKIFRLAREKIIAIATDSTLRPTTTVPDPLLPGAHKLGFGQDLTFSTGRAQPHGPSVGSTPVALRAKMRKLLTEFASNDTHGKARRLFNEFLKPQTAVSFWSDKDLTAAAQAHPNVISFVSRALSAPTSPDRIPGGRTRIHQALQNAGWDINAAVVPTDLGVPAFNRGSGARGTEDWGNGLKVMINGIQHGIVVAKDYYYNQCNHEYYIKLEYVFYDVFGLDDDDLLEFGADGGIVDSDAAEGITAWWQLQHQHGHAPLITRIAFEREFTVPVP